MSGPDQRRARSAQAGKPFGQRHDALVAEIAEHSADQQQVRLAVGVLRGIAGITGAKLDPTETGGCVRRPADCSQAVIELDEQAGHVARTRMAVEHAEQVASVADAHADHLPWNVGKPSEGRADVALHHLESPAQRRGRVVVITMPFVPVHALTMARWADEFRGSDGRIGVACFVLVPGAGGVAWYWHRVVPLLQALGHDAVAVDLPGDDDSAGLPEYAAITREVMKQYDEVVLVGQSLGGFTSALVSDAPNVSRLTFVNAMIPNPGETAGAWWDNTGQAEARAAAATKSGYPVEFDLDTYFLHDVPIDVAASGADEQRDESDAVFASVCDFTWPAVPITVIAGADDRFFPLEFQQRVSRDRLGLDPVVIPGGHLVALSNPEGLATQLMG